MLQNIGLLVGPPLKCHSAEVATEIDNSYTSETVFRQSRKHNGVLLVRVNSDVIVGLAGKIEDSLEYSMTFAIGSKAMNDGVMSINLPPSVAFGHGGVVGVRTAYESKSSNRMVVVVHDDVAVACLNIGTEKSLAGDSVGPLLHIARGPHYFASGVAY